MVVLEQWLLSLEAMDQWASVGELFTLLGLG